MTVEMWLIYGLTLILVELVILPGLGLLFAGLGALITAIILLYCKNAYHYEYLIFIFTSCLWCVAFWLPWQAAKVKNNPLFQDICGQYAEVISKTFDHKTIGQVIWSGTIMNAKMFYGDEIAHYGDILLIKIIRGNILFCQKDKNITNKRL